MALLTDVAWVGSLAQELLQAAGVAKKKNIWCLVKYDVSDVWKHHSMDMGTDRTVSASQNTNQEAMTNHQPS